jgi:hypothetical protein
VKYPLITLNGAGSIIGFGFAGYADAQIGLYKNNIVPSLGQVITPGLPSTYGLVECDFGGYARVTVDTGTWKTDYSQQTTGDIIQVPPGPIRFAATDAVSPQSAYGWFLAIPSGPAVFAICPFDEPLLFNASGDAGVVYPVLRWPAIRGGN